MTAQNPDIDPFEGHAPIPGLEHLGRHIHDARGAPSGSPANFEHLRGRLAEGTAPIAAADLDSTYAALRQEFGEALPNG